MEHILTAVGGILLFVFFPIVLVIVLLITLMALLAVWFCRKNKIA